jgi:hypothetical protein
MSAAAAVVGAVMAGSPNERHATGPKSLSQDQNQRILGGVAAHDSVSCRLIVFHHSASWILIAVSAPRPLVLTVFTFYLYGSSEIVYYLVLLLHFLLQYPLHKAGLILMFQKTTAALTHEKTVTALTTSKLANQHCAKVSDGCPRKRSGRTDHDRS